jgi:hypothetical protein
MLVALYIRGRIQKRSKRGEEEDENSEKAMSMPLRHHSR